MRRLTVDIRPGGYTVVRLPGDAALPAGLLDGATADLVSVTRTADELSVVCRTESAGSAAQAEHGWRLLTVRGPMEFTLTGITAAVSGALAAAGVPLFSVSTFDTDHLLVKDDDLARATRALRDAGHEVVG